MRCPAAKVESARRSSKQAKRPGTRPSAVRPGSPLPPPSQPPAAFAPVLPGQLLAGKWGQVFGHDALDHASGAGSTARLGGLLEVGKWSRCRLADAPGPHLPSSRVEHHVELDGVMLLRLVATGAVVHMEEHLPFGKGDEAVTFV